MPRYRPDQWMPPEDLADIKCTIPQLWSRYHQQTAALCRLAQSTVQEYTTQLGIIYEALASKPAAMMTCYDIWEAVRSVQGYHRTGEWVLYSTSAFVKRLAAIHDLYRYCESVCICCDVLDIPPWRLLFPEGAPDFTLDAADVAKNLKEMAAKTPKCRYLTLSQERRLVRQILEHIQAPDPNAGLWAGLAILVYTGLRGNELRALRFSSFRKFRATERQPRRYIDVTHTVTETGRAQDSVKTVNAIRRIPEHIELSVIMTLATSQRRAMLRRDDISDLPVVCGTDPSAPCSAVELMVFAKRLLTSIVDADTRDGMALACYVAEDNTGDAAELAAKDVTDIEGYCANQSITMRVLRRNLATKLYAETTLTDVGVRLWMGHKQDVGVHLKAPYGEDDVWAMLQAADHRMIAPDLHPGWVREIGQGESVLLAQVSKQFLRLPCDLARQGTVITLELETCELGDSISVDLKRLLPKGASVEIDTDYRPAPSPSARIITDHSHWQLPQWPDERGEIGT